MPSRSVQDYLKAIFILSQSSESVKSVDIARELNVTKPTVSSMVARLSKSGLVKSQRYGQVELTKEGLKEALIVTHRFRVAADFLERLLGMSRKEAFSQAHNLEHALNEKAVQKLEVLMLECGKCRNGRTDPVSDIGLSEVRAGDTVEIVRLECAGPIRRRLIEMGLIKGAKVKVEKLAPFGDPMEISVLNTHLSMRKRDAKMVIVK